MQEIPLGKRQFGEGLTKIGNNLFTLTWRTGIIIKWEVEGGVLKKVCANTNSITITICMQASVLGLNLVNRAVHGMCLHSRLLPKVAVQAL